MHNYYEFGLCFKKLRKNTEKKSDAWQACLDKPEFQDMKKPIIGDNMNLNESALQKIDRVLEEYGETLCQLK